MPQDTPAAVPRPALWLGLGGLIPFYACAVGAHLLPPPWDVAALGWMVGYGAVILSFLGGVHWGLSLAGYGAPGGGGPTPPPSVNWTRLGWSVVPSIVAWAAFFIPSPAGALGLLLLAFLGLAYGDLRAVAAGVSPAWYLGMRKPLTLLVNVALVVGILAAV